MTLPVYPNSINLNQIQAEFGGATPPFSLSQYYAGGGRVASGLIGYPLGVATAIPSSGTISLGNFSGATRRVIVTVTISASTQNYIANTAKVTGYVAGITDVTFVINAGVVVSSASTGSFAFTVNTSWAAGDSVTVTNNGTIVAAGGAGGAGADQGNAGNAGGGGGPAVYVQKYITWNNTSGTVAGGGGGGGGGGYYGFKEDAYGGDGGGGGRGLNGGAGGAGGTAVTANGSAGTAGTYTAAGLGGGGTIPGGNGGGFGSAGAAGGAATTAGGSGGAAGVALLGTAYVNGGGGFGGGVIYGSQT